MLLLAATAIIAQTSQLKSLVSEGSNCGGKHAVGDAMTCYVTFAGTADFSKVEVAFNRQEQGGGNFILRASRKLDAHTYEVSGTMDRCLSGNYMLADVMASRGNAYRDYQKGYGLSSDIAVEVEEVPIVETSPKNEPNTALPIGTNVVLPSPSSITDVKATKCEPDLPEITAIGSAIPAGSNPFAEIAKSLRRMMTKNHCGGKHSPSDKVSCYVRFADDVEISSLFISFGLGNKDRGTTDQTPKDQRGLCTDFSFDQYRRIDSHIYEIGGIVPACRSGRYVLSDVVAFRTVGGADRSCRRREYNKASDLRNPPALSLQNSNQTLFPELLEVSARATVVPPIAQ